MAKVALRLVEALFSEEEIELWTDDSSKDAHSLHQVLFFGGVRPEVAQFLINRFSTKGEVVLDPFCGSGGVPLEASLLSRTAIAVDINPLHLAVTSAKIEPADLTEVTLSLQQMNLRKPVSLNAYQEAFSDFYDPDTYRELLNLRSWIHEKRDRIARFVQLIAMSLLHGHTAGYFSVYTSPHISLTPQDQKGMNYKRRQAPDYRAVMPRLLRKTAFALRDSNGSSFRNDRAKVIRAEARDLNFISTPSVDLVITSPPLPSTRNFASDNWLRLWMAGVQPKNLPRYQFPTLESWTEFMNEVLVELARVVRRGGRVALDLREVRIDRQRYQLDQELLTVVETHLSRFWEAECVILHKPKFAQVKEALRAREDARLSTRNRILVLRRR